MEFRVVEYCLIRFLFERDAMKVYKMIIDENSVIWVNSIGSSIKIPIIERTRYDSRCIYSQIFIVEIIYIKPGECHLIFVRYQVSDESISYIFASPVRINHITRIYASCLHSLMQPDMTYLCMVNTGHRHAKVIKDTIIAIYAPVTINMVYIYLNVINTSISISKGMVDSFNLVELAISNPLNAIDIIK